MGSAIVGALVKAGHKVWVSNRSHDKLERLKKKYPEIHITDYNVDAAANADVVVLAIKPASKDLVINQLLDEFDPRAKTFVSVMGGVSVYDLHFTIGDIEHACNIYQVIPDTAIKVGHGMTFITALNPDDEVTASLEEVFGLVGKVAFVEPDKMDAATLLSSCGIAYAYKYIQACVQAGVELGFSAPDALKYTLATVDGAVAMLERPGATPQGEIDRVCSPGGMTIRGINALEQQAFTAAVINAIKKPLE